MGAGEVERGLAGFVGEIREGNLPAAATVEILEGIRGDGGNLDAHRVPEAIRESERFGIEPQQQWRARRKRGSFHTRQWESFRSGEASQSLAIENLP